MEEKFYPVVDESEYVLVVTPEGRVCRVTWESFMTLFEYPED